MPLSDITLIEASAGTGKTWTLTRIFLRLLIEKEMSVDSILVMTFTKAATHELRQRIRAALVSALERTDPDINSYLDSFDKEKCRLRLRLALHRFDSAPIHTIHAFASSVLASFALESGQPIGLTLAESKESKELLELAAADFWRREIATLPVEWLKFMGGPEPDYFSAIAGNSSPFVKIYPDIIDNENDWEKIKEEGMTALAAFKYSWNIEKEEVYKYLTTPKAFDGRKIQARYADRWFKIADRVARMESIFAITNELEVLEKISRNALTNAVAKCTLLRNFGYFDSLDTLFSLFAKMQMRIVELKYKSIGTINTILNKLKREKGLTTFDDLLSNVYSGLSGKLLKTALKNKYKVALIDEFQDTDPLQYKITESLFGEEGRPLILIGDPKQAIYQFRGADLFTYLNATKTIPDSSKFTITTNYRSDGKLIDGVNALFSEERRENVFILEGLHYRTINKPQSTPTCGSGITLLELKNPNNDQSLIVESRKRIVEAVSAKISSMLLGGYAKPQEIAVLTRTNVEAQLIKAALSALNIPSVTDAENDLFLSIEANELRLFLVAVFSYNNRHTVQPFLLSTWGGLTPDAVRSFEESSDRYILEINQMKSIKGIWERSGIAAAFETYDRTSKLRERLIKLEDGERIIANINHLIEILSEHEEEEGLSPLSLIGYLDKEMDEKSMGRETYQLRLERDDSAVVVQTIHRSKGLEYPIVFCPFAWSRSQRPKPPYSFHDDEGNRLLGIDPADDTAIGNAQLESNAESIRLLYVALTRAKKSCYVVFGNIKESDSSALNHLLFGKDVTENWNEALSILDSMKEHLTIDILDEEPGQTISDNTVSGIICKAKDFKRMLEKNFSISSFTSLSRSIHSTEYASGKEWDEGKKVIPDETAELPKGKTVGSCIHKMFENIDFNSYTYDELKNAATLALDYYSLPQSHTEKLISMAQLVLTTELHQTMTAFTLSKLSKNKRIAEMQFHLPLSALEADTLNSIVSLSNQLNFKTVSGYLLGFIDLVFEYEGRYYILDWKSNHLGNTINDYTSEAIESAMDHSSYKLQYYLYIAALNRYLSAKIPDYNYNTHFGGVFYLFVRGISNETKWNRGVYFDRPDESVIISLDNAFKNSEDKK
jgi:exodeoxyribonuclease V beta subunit